MSWIKDSFILFLIGTSMKTVWSTGVYHCGFLLATSTIDLGDKLAGSVGTPSITGAYVPSGVPGRHRNGCRASSHLPCEPSTSGHLRM
jgi:hypothetical protein